MVPKLNNKLDFMEKYESNPLKNVKLNKDFHNGSVKEFLKGLYCRNDAKFDNFIAIEDNEGNGKSNANLVFCKGLSKKFSIDTSHVFNNPTYEKVRNAFKTLGDWECIDIDEAGDTFYKRNWNTSGQKSIISYFMKSRKKKKNVFMCIPRFDDLDEYFRNWRVMYRVVVPYRGCGVVFMRDIRKDIQEPWHQKENDKLMRNLSSKYSRGFGSNKGWGYKQLMSPEDYLNILRNQMGYVMDFHIPKISDVEEKLYLGVVESNNREEDENEENDKIDFKFLKKDISLNAVASLFRNGLVKDGKELSKFLDMNIRYAYRYVEELKNRGMIRV